MDRYTIWTGWGLSLLVLGLLACSTDELSRNCEDRAPLSTVIIGQWELTAQKGFPYAQDRFEPVENTQLRLRFAADSTLVFQGSGADTYGHYLVNDSLGEIAIRTSVDFVWTVVDYSSCSFVVQLPGSDEGPVYHQYEFR